MRKWRVGCVAGQGGARVPEVERKRQSEWSCRKFSGRCVSRYLDPHRLVGSDEPDSVVEMRIAEHGRVTSLESVQVKGGVLLRVAVGRGSLKGGRRRRVGHEGRRRDVEVVLANKRRGHHQGATLSRHGNRVVEHGHLLGTVVKGRVVVDVGLVASNANLLGSDREVGRVELGERTGPLGVDPTHARAKLADSVDGELHQSQGSVGALGSAGDAHRHEASGNLLNREDGKGSKVRGTNLGEEALHEQSYSVEVGNDNQRVGRGTVVLQVADGHPEEPGAERLQALILLGNGERRADFASTLEEANQMLDLGGLLLVVSKMGLDLLNLIQGALESLEIILARLRGTVLGIGRGRSSGECAALGNEVGEERLVLPGLHGVDDGGGALHQLSPAAPVVGLPGQDQRGGQNSVRSLAREGTNGGVQAGQGNAAVLKSHVADATAVGQEGNVHGGKGQEGVHDVGSGGTDAEKTIWPVSSDFIHGGRVNLRRNVARPESEVVGIHSSELVVEGSKVVDEAQILDRIELRHGGRVDGEGREREDSSSLPLGNVGLNLRSPHQVGLVGGSGALRLGSDLHVIVGAADLVLGAVAALGEALVTANVTALAGFTALARLGVAAARRTTTGTGHCVEKCEA